MVGEATLTIDENRNMLCIQSLSALHLPVAGAYWPLCRLPVRSWVEHLTAACVVFLIATAAAFRAVLDVMRVDEWSVEVTPLWVGTVGKAGSFAGVTPMGRLLGLAWGLGGACLWDCLLPLFATVEGVHSNFCGSYSQRRTSILPNSFGQSGPWGEKLLLCIVEAVSGAAMVSGAVSQRPPWFVLGAEEWGVCREASNAGRCMLENSEHLFREDMP